MFVEMREQYKEKKIITYDQLENRDFSRKKYINLYILKVNSIFFAVT